MGSRKSPSERWELSSFADLAAERSKLEPMVEGPEIEEGETAVVEGKNVETRGGGIERIAEEVPMEGRETVTMEDIGREGNSEMREEMEERSAREEKIDEE
ncbi:hypothetical protein KI387_037789, partial [Taxus chinensis]